MDQQQLYAEVGCKPKSDGKDYAMRVGAIVLTILLIFVIVFLPVPFLVRLVAALGIGAIIYWYPNLKYEYEYIYCDGQLDFDKIMGGARRKTVVQVQLDEVECIAPENSHSAQGFHDAKVMDFSSREPQNKKYVLLGKAKEEKLKIYFEPSERMLECMQAKAPRKVQIKA